MKVILLVSFAVLLVFCATDQRTTSMTNGWPSFAYEGFGAKVERLAGASAIDCGVINKVGKNDPVNKGNSAAKARVRQEKYGKWRAI